jgi:hypothetical protein
VTRAAREQETLLLSVCSFQAYLLEPAVVSIAIVQVVGIWFYDDADCDRISALLQRIASTFAAPAEAAAGAAVSLASLPGFLVRRLVSVDNVKSVGV